MQALLATAKVVSNPKEILYYEGYKKEKGDFYPTYDIQRSIEMQKGLYLS